MRCVICGSTERIEHLNTNSEQLLCEYLEIKWDSSSVVSVCKVCIAAKELTGEWQMICSVCKKGFAKPPAPCDKCGGLACKDCYVKELPPGTWEIKFNVNAAAGRIHVCKNCVAERNLTENSDPTTFSVEGHAAVEFDPKAIMKVPKAVKIFCPNGQVLDAKEGDVLRWDTTRKEGSIENR